MDSEIQLGVQKVRLYNKFEAAEYCGGADGSVHTSTIERWRYEGYLRYVWVGGLKRKQYLYTKDALDECLTLKGYTNRIESEKESGNTTRVREI